MDLTFVQSRRTYHDLYIVEHSDIFIIDVTATVKVTHWVKRRRHTNTMSNESDVSSG